jgi:hypothetical protein
MLQDKHVARINDVLGAIIRVTSEPEAGIALSTGLRPVPGVLRPSVDLILSLRQTYVTGENVEGVFDR